MELDDYPTWCAIQGETLHWDLENPDKAPQTFEHKSKEVSSSIAVAASPNDHRFVSIDNDHNGVCRIWDPIAGKEIARCENLRGPSRAEFSPDGKKIAIGTTQDVVIVNSANGEVLKRIPHEDGGHLCWLSFSPDGRNLIFSGYFFRRVHVMDVEKGVISETLNFHEQRAVSAVHWCRDGKEVIVLNSNRWIKFISTTDTTQARDIALSGMVRDLTQTLSVSRDESVLCFSEGNSNAIMLNAKTSKSAKLSNHWHPAISPNGRFLASVTRHLPRDTQIIVESIPEVLKSLEIN